MESKSVLLGCKNELKLFTTEPYIRERKIFSLIMKNTILLSAIYT